jgi:predicted O-methyltransferase YrrM
MAWNIQNLRTRIASGSLPGRIWRWGRSPATIPVVLAAPESLSNLDAVCALFSGTDRSQAESFCLEFLRNSKFFEELNRNFVEKRHRRTNCDGWKEFLYMTVRMARPNIMVETGVFDGVSSAVILQAMRDNGCGELISVDLPATETIQGSTNSMPDTTLPPNVSPGWTVPDYLREHYHLILGDSRELLPEIWDQYPKIDIFFHDSLHTFEHMYFEYATAWPHLATGGLLLSDDIFWSTAFHKFCKEKGKVYVNVDGFGAVRK